MRAWTQIETDYLDFIMQSEPNQTYEHYARKMEIEFKKMFSSEKIRNKLRRKKVKYVNQKNAQERDVGELLKTLIESQKKLQDFDDRQTEVSIEIDDDKPIGIVFSGDQHIGSLYTDHEQMIKDYEVIKNIDGLYVILMGDLRDNYITRSHAGGSFEQAFTANNQAIVAEHVIEEYLSEKTLVVLKGNHDAWSVKETGEDFIQYLARKIGKPFLWYGGEIKINLNGANYLIHAHHTHRNHSSLNTTNSQRNLFNNTHADVIALGHLHFNEVHNKSGGKNKDTIWIRSGSYKIQDDYGQYLGGLKGDSRLPMVILYPKEKKLLPFRDMYDGIDYLKMVRS
jgi:predicted phosphodiesterase